MASRRKSGRPYKSGGYSYGAAGETATATETETSPTPAATEPPIQAAPPSSLTQDADSDQVDQAPPAATPRNSEQAARERVAAMPCPPVRFMYTRRGVDLKEAAVVAVATGSVSAPPEKAAGGGDNVEDLSGKLLFAQKKLTDQYVAIGKALVSLKKIDNQLPEVTEAIAVLTKSQLEFLDP